MQIIKVPFYNKRTQKDVNRKERYLINSKAIVYVSFSKSRNNNYYLFEK